uniref:Uncharacterized protein n=1 Tax=viral metagenome TaxID=1070528 RepID=A0A6C0BRR4_9ZZZZ
MPSLFVIVTYSILGYSLLYIIVLMYIPSCIGVIAPWRTKSKEGMNNDDRLRPTHKETYETVKKNKNRQRSELTPDEDGIYMQLITEIESSLEPALFRYIFENADSITSAPMSDDSISKISKINEVSKFIEYIGAYPQILKNMG